MAKNEAKPVSTKSNGAGEYDETNRITIYAVSNRESERHPSHWGKMNVNGVEYKISLWPKVGKEKGTKFLAGVIQSVEESEAAKSSAGKASKDAGMPF